jgi:formamidopyrimidine-DNA glycosylase
MAFRFSRGNWLAIHLGMTGRLRVEPPDFKAGNHDHLLLRQPRRVLVFSDPRQFGRVLFFQGRGEPPWWSKLPPALTSREFSREVLGEVLQRHRRLPIKGALLLQRHFPGVGNWMADEILWRSGLNPRTSAGGIRDERLDVLHGRIRFVCRGAMKHVARDFSDPPRGWFYHERWGREGTCPRDGTALRRDTIGGRTTAWCPKCQR